MTHATTWWQKMASDSSQLVKYSMKLPAEAAVFWQTWLCHLGKDDPNQNDHNGRAHFEKRKQLLEYKNVLFLRHLVVKIKIYITMLLIFHHQC
jgi:hypothetical protein